MPLYYLFMVTIVAATARERKETERRSSMACCDLIKSTIKWIPFVRTSSDAAAAAATHSLTLLLISKISQFSSPPDRHLQGLLSLVQEIII